MAERQPAGPWTVSTRHQWFAPLTTSGGPSLLRRLQGHTPSSNQVVISGCILLLLTSLALTGAGAVAALTFFGPIVLLTSPMWVPVGFVMFVVSAAVLSACGFGVAALAGASWLYNHFMGRHPAGPDRVDCARSRIADGPSDVTDYAWAYGGCPRSRVKDAAPGA
ncbi:Oleosin [Musa troglodytarum]|uniref:Oleosin n=1 Tax=Musa troglodytarum TaxID=320322 RepID=A0A9E7EEV2_9LILI|nr:Oleosin [Musa troglodytarum]